MKLRRSLRTIFETSEPIERPHVGWKPRMVKGKATSYRLLSMHAGRRTSAVPLCGRIDGHFDPIGQRWGRARHVDRLVCADCVALAPINDR